MDDAERKLDMLLDYWIEHNREHEKEFRDWAENVSTARGDVADMLLKAAGGLAQATSYLEEARRALQ